MRNRDEHLNELSAKIIRKLKEMEKLNELKNCIAYSMSFCGFKEKSVALDYLRVSKRIKYKMGAIKKLICKAIDIHYGYNTSESIKYKSYKEQVEDFKRVFNLDF